MSFWPYCILRNGRWEFRASEVLECSGICPPDWPDQIEYPGGFSPGGTLTLDDSNSGGANYTDHDHDVSIRIIDDTK